MLFGGRKKDEIDQLLDSAKSLIGELKEVSEQMRRAASQAKDAAQELAGAVERRLQQDDEAHTPSPLE